MSENNARKIQEAKEIPSTASTDASASVAAEVANQLNDYAQGKKISRPSDQAVSQMIRGYESFNVLSDKERDQAVVNLSKSLNSMVVGDIPQLRKRLEELGVSTKELEEKEAKLKEKVEAAKPVQEAILKGDVKALQKMVTEMKPEQLTEITELIQKHFDQQGMGIEVDFTEGKLILSGTKADRAVLISKDKLDVIGVNADGSYDFARHFRRENAATELKQLSDGAITNHMFPPRRFGWKEEIPMRPLLDSSITPNSLEKFSK